MLGKQEASQATGEGMDVISVAKSGKFQFCNTYEKMEESGLPTTYFKRASSEASCSRSERFSSRI